MMFDAMSYPQIAVISDIHGNLWALEAVLEYITKRKIKYEWEASVKCAKKNNHRDWAKRLRTGNV